MPSNRWTHSNTTVYNIGYHIIWCPKYRRKVLTGKIEVRLGQLLLKKAEEIGVSIIEMQIMPDHVHGLVIINKTDFNLVNHINIEKIDDANAIGSQRFRNPGKNNISSIIGSFKSVCTKHIHIQYPEINFAWQSRFHDHIVRNDKEFKRIQQYIINNPKNWHKNKFNHNL